MKLEGLIQSCLNNPSSPTADSSAMQLAGTAEGFTWWQWVNSCVHICTISHCRDAIRKKTPNDRTSTPWRSSATSTTFPAQPSIFL